MMEHMKILLWFHLSHSSGIKFKLIIVLKLRQFRICFGCMVGLLESKDFHTFSVVTEYKVDVH